MSVRSFDVTYRLLLSHKSIYQVDCTFCILVYIILAYVAWRRRLLVADMVTDCTCQQPHLGHGLATVTSMQNRLYSCLDVIPLLSRKSYVGLYITYVISGVLRCFYSHVAYYFFISFFPSSYLASVMASNLGFSFG